jgi:hypothetical protein
MTPKEIAWLTGIRLSGRPPDRITPQPGDSMLDWDKLLNQVAVVMATPIPFIVAILIVAALIWWLMNWRYSAVISHRDAEIVLLNGQRDDYKDKFSGATPDQAKARMDALESRLAKIEPRRQTESQRELLNAPPRALTDQIHYVDGIRFLVEPYFSEGSEAGARLIFNPLSYMDRLRVFVEFCTASGNPQLPWQGCQRIPLADRHDVFKGQETVVEMIHEEHFENQKPQFWWGARGAQKTSEHLIMWNKNKARIVFVGPDNKEQNFEIAVFRTRHDRLTAMEGSPSLLIIDKKEMETFYTWPE